MTLFFRFYMFIWDNMIVEVCAKERKKKKSKAWNERSKAQNPSPPLANFVPRLGQVLSDCIQPREWALINLPGSHAHWHSDIIYRESPAIAKMVLLTDMSYLLHHISSCVISRWIDTRLSLCSSLLLVWKTSRVAAAVCLLKLHVAP